MVNSKSTKSVVTISSELLAHTFILFVYSIVTKAAMMKNAHVNFKKLDLDMFFPPL
jgi:hypothetical protein